MGILSNHIENHCDKRMVGVLSLGIREAYGYLEELIAKEKILQKEEMRKTWGHIRNGLVDVGLKRVLESSNIPHEVVDKTSSRYSNGYTYLMVETKGGILTPAKVEKPGSVPPRAIFRSTGSVMNKQYNLFENPSDLNEKYDEKNPPFMLLTYGGLNYKLDFVRLGIPDLDVQSWIDQIDIIKSPVLLPNTEEVRNDLHLTFTAESEQIIRRSEENAREDGI